MAKRWWKVVRRESADNRGSEFMLGEGELDLVSFKEAHQVLELLLCKVEIVGIGALELQDGELVKVASSSVEFGGIQNIGSVRGL